TTTVANLGCGLALRGRRVVMIDADIGLRNLDVVLGLENRIVFDLVDVVEKKCRLRQAMIRDKRFEGLYLLPAAQTREKDAVAPEQMRAICRELREEFDYVLVDCPAGIEQGFKNAVAGADEAIIVTTPEVSSVRDADRIVGLLQARDLTDPWLVINRIRPEMIRKGDMMDIDDVNDILALDLLGIIPDDESVITSTNRGEPVIAERGSRAGEAFRNIAGRLEGENIPFMSMDFDLGIFGRLKRLIGM
ncbi:MAG: septum site-determining protein MinD, partial [Firmicutes bacterium]|nr:septum site-determining protein MinD [Bacillota bacterium]